MSYQTADLIDNAFSAHLTVASEESKGSFFGDPALMKNARVCLSHYKTLLEERGITFDPASEQIQSVVAERQAERKLRADRLAEERARDAWQTQMALEAA